MGYDFEVTYRKGELNVVTNALSRKPEFVEPQILDLSTFSTNSMEKIEELWEQDKELAKLISELKSESHKHSKYSWKGNQLRRKGN